MAITGASVHETLVQQDWRSKRKTRAKLGLNDLDFVIVGLL